MKVRSVFAAAVLLLTGCAGPQVAKAPPPGPLAKADWDHAKSCTLVITDQGFQGKDLVFVEGEASILRIQNATDQPLSLKADEFFRSISPWKLATFTQRTTLPLVCGREGVMVYPPALPEETVLAGGPKLVSIESKPGQVQALYFVPEKSGIYSLDCKMIATATCSMGGSISVIPKSM